MSTGGFVNNGESIGIGVFDIGDIGGDDDCGEREEEGQEEGKNEDEDIDSGDRGVEEQVDMESFRTRVPVLLLLH